MQAKDIFNRIYPDQEFLPRAPDPEEIIIGDEADDNDVGQASGDTSGDLKAVENGGEKKELPKSE